MGVSLLKSLNEEQKKAVSFVKGPSLILAGAGSGKTRVLTYKVAYLIASEKIPAENILTVTFTNKASQEMKERLRILLKDDKGKQLLPLTSTFHSFCASLLRKEGKFIGLSPDFLIYDDLDTKEAILEAMADLAVDKKKFSPQAIAATIAGAKNELIDAAGYADIARGFFQETVKYVYPRYQKILNRNRAVDFEDLIFFTVNLFRENKDILEKYQRIFKYILVDEYQDTNHAQYVLTKLLAQKYQNLTVVGDAAQSIYAWRGADYRNIVNFQKDYPKARIFHLEKNYRSSQNILDAAFTIISKNQSHPILRLWTDKSAGSKITIFEAYSEHQEASFIVNKLEQTDFGSSAVLYRTNAQSRIIEEALLHAGIPYILVGGVRFYERKEIKDVLCYLKLIINPTESVALKRAAKIGKRKLEKYLDYLEEKQDLKDKTTLELLDKILEVTSYLDQFNQENPEELSRLENIKELRSVASEFPLLNEFLEQVALIEREYTSDHPLVDNEKRVTLLTMHAAKGLEFENVFMIGMEEGLFPHSMTLLDPLELEEERRLCYVGITRAKENLVMSYAKRRMIFGQRTNNEVSRFVSELPEELVELAADWQLI